MKAYWEKFKSFFASKNKVNISDRYTNIFVAEVKHWEKHPNADRLRLVRVKVGSREVWPVVCGAANFDTGDRVIFAFPGAQVLDTKGSGKTWTLTRATIRGVESQGMLCSAAELGLGEEHAGIVVLDQSKPSGLEFSAYLKSKNNRFS